MPFYIWHATLLGIFLMLMIGKLIKLPIVTTVWAKRKFLKETVAPVENSIEQFPYTKQRREFLQKGIIALSGVAFVGSVYGTFRRNDYDIVNVTFPIPNLPNEFNNFTMTLVADIHSSVFMSKERMTEYAEVINAQHSDMILMPGDFVTQQLDEIYPFAEAFSSLKAPSGVYGVLGNHDFYTGEVTAVAKEVNACGIKLLRNDCITLQKNGSTLHLLGLDDISTNQQAENALNYAMRSIKDDSPKILMCHRPYFFDVAEKKGIALTLSGHTHGGQIVFFRAGTNIIAPARMASPYVAGSYLKNNSILYVNRGLGTVGIPVRINCPPEITKIRLVKA